MMRLIQLSFRYYLPGLLVHPPNFVIFTTVLLERAFHKLPACFRKTYGSRRCYQNAGTPATFGNRRLLAMRIKPRRYCVAVCCRPAT